MKNPNKRSKPAATPQPNFNPEASAKTPYTGIPTPDFMTPDGGSVYKHFIEPGDDPQKLLMRTVFPDKATLVHIVKWKGRIDKFNQKRHLTMLLDLLAGFASIQGRSRAELMAAHTGVIAPRIFETIYGLTPGAAKEQAKADGNHNESEDEE